MSGWNETAREAAERVNRVRGEWGDWVRSREWNHCVHLTVEGKWCAERLQQRFEREYLRFCTKVAQGPVAFAFSIEGGALGDQAHLHGLLYGTQRLDCTRLALAWRYGRAEVTVYDPQRGAAHYNAKEIGGRVLDYGVSGRMPPRREECLESSSLPQRRRTALLGVAASVLALCDSLQEELS